ncbi:MAG TPA: hypothetical protein VN157_16900 [Caulobacter sp.]|nr:hypothetical protein [Caulobacter sp.]
MDYQPDDEWMGKVFVHVATDDFAGLGSAWVGLQQLQDFAEALKRHPLIAEEAAQFEVGYGGSLAGLTPAQTLIRVTLRRYGPLGKVLVRAELWAERDFSISADHDLHQAVDARFLTDYATIDRFASQLGAIVAGRSTQARLEGAKG